MRSAQPGIFAQGTRSHHYLELDVRAGADRQALCEALGRLRQPQVTAGGLNLVVALGSALLRRLVPQEEPAGLAPFEAMEGPSGLALPATPHDLWVWVHGTGPDIVLDGARSVAAAVRPVATVAYEQSAFVYRDGRDMTGFVDGTENPLIDDAPEVAVVSEGPGEGGSHVLVMRWVHDLAAFDRLDVDEQQAVFGRTKVASEDLGDVKPPTAHIARVVVEEDGEELEIYRRSTPFGTVAEQGLYFVAFSADPSRFTTMLHRMIGLSGDGLHDRLMELSRATSAATYFAPSLQVLAALGAEA